MNRPVGKTDGVEMIQIGSALTEKGGIVVPDREKVIKGLELCEIGSGDRCYETECPYYGQECTESLKNDIFELLKEQEAVKPMKRIEENEWTVCGCCKNHIISKWSFCPYCGKAVKWE